MFEVGFMWRVKTSGCGEGEGGLDSQIRGKGQGYIPKMLGPRNRNNSPRTWASPIIKWLYPP
jgi:hypothetical protein